MRTAILTLLIVCFVFSPNLPPEKELKVHYTKDTVTEANNQPQLIEFIATAYCPCEKCCGKWAKNRKGSVRGCKGDLLESGKTIAVDFKTIPYGSTLIINGKEYKAVDCGGGIKGNRIDFYFDSHEEAKKFGKQVVYGYIKEETK